jgi:ribosomal protein L11 methyltransferase
MLESQLEIPHQGKQVLDVGCGTGILSVMASKLNAAIVDAFDIDDWAVENAIENAQLNNCPNVHVQKGTIQEVKLASAYDIILANINRNVLLNEIPKYAALLPGQGWLLVSGFYEKDLEDIEKIAAQNSLKKVRQKVKNQWMAVVFQK